MEPSNLVLGPESTSIGSEPVCAYHLKIRQILVIRFTDTLQKSTPFYPVLRENNPRTITRLGRQPLNTNSRRWSTERLVRVTRTFFFHRVQDDARETFEKRNATREK